MTLGIIETDVVSVFEIVGEPMSKGRPRFGNGRTYTPMQTLQAEALVARAFMFANPGYVPDPDARFAVHFAFVMGTKRRKDIDNIMKLVLDGLNTVAWVDDHQVIATHAYKLIGSPTRARTLVTIFTATQGENK